MKNCNDFLIHQFKRIIWLRNRKSIIQIHISGMVYREVITEVESPKAHNLLLFLVLFLIMYIYQISLFALIFWTFNVMKVGLGFYMIS